jgi:4-diphosphocytidyl-2-C-methyl-D-erythritol kinase
MPTLLKIQGAFIFRTPAKITIHLRVLSKRNDGYHDVRVALAPVGLYDTIAWQPGGEQLFLEVSSAEALGPVEQNLVFRGALAFQVASGLSVHGRLRLEKRVPSGAGLGGGSANAAGTLVVLNRLYGEPLSEHRLWELAQQLGSDVAFFLRPCPQWAEGRGERLTPIASFPRLHVLVIKPPFGISTAQAYSKTVPRPESYPLPPLRSLQEVLTALANDFELALFPEYPALSEIKERLLAAGARGALLSGSGSAVFGLFTDAAARDQAMAELAQESSRRGIAWMVLPCDTLERHDYVLTPCEALP